MRWFRSRRKSDEQAPVEAAAPSQAPKPVSTEPADEAGQSSTTRPRRRRGSRGGRGRSKKTTAAEAKTETAQPKAKTAPRPRTERKPAAPRRERERPAYQRRRREPPRRAPLPEAKRELLVSVDVGEQRVAVLEDDQVAEVYLERPERRSIAGNIYLGTVDNVLPGMEAAFIEIGLEKNGFLYVDEIVTPELEGKARHGKKIQDLISRGQTIMVQAVKDPMKTKGARLTTEISLPGRFVVYQPNGDGFGVSRRLDDEERSRLKDILKGLDLKGGGVIVRTAAEGASAEDIERDLLFLQKVWKSIDARAKKAKPPTPALPGGRAAAPRHARSLHRELRARAGRPGPGVQAHRRLPEEDVAAHGRARRALQGEAAVDGGLRGRCGDQVDSEPSCGPAVGRLSDLRLRRGVHGHRRQHRPLRRLALEARRARGSRTRSRRTTSKR